MRIIDQDITGVDMSVLALQFYNKVCPINKTHSNFNANYFAGKLQKLADKSNSKKKYYPVYKYLFDNLETLITGTPDELETFDKNFKNHLENDGILHYLGKRQCKKNLRKIFHNAYSNFRTTGKENHKIQWFENFKLRTCPYCNRNWTSKVMNNENSEFILYFDVDHYWPKASYPWFAISFYNLIPSCTICNQRIKNSDELEPENHIHPFRDDMHKYLKFHVPLSSSQDFFDDKVKITLEVIPRFPYTINDEKYKKSKNTYDFFNLHNFYNTHLDYVRELMQKDVVYSKNYIQSLLSYKSKSGEPIFENETDILKMIIGNYSLPEDIHKRPLSKLTQDILEDFTNRVN